MRISLSIFVGLLAFTAYAAGTDDLEIVIGENDASTSQRDGVLINPQWSPAFSLLYRHDAFFIDTENGVGYRLLDQEKFNFGVALDYQYGRHVHSDSRYRGLDNVNGSVAPAAFIEWEPIKNAIDVYANASKAVSGSNGWLYKIELTTGLPINPVVSFYINAAAHAGDKNYSKTYYGVSSSQSLTSYYPAYAPSGGWISADYSAGAQFTCSKNFSFSMQAGFSQYLDSVAHSPLVNHRRTTIGGIYATYSY